MGEEVLHCCIEGEKVGVDGSKIVYVEITAGRRGVTPLHRGGESW